MTTSTRIVNIMFFFLLSLGFTLYLYNEAFVSETNFSNLSSDYGNIQILYSGIINKKNSVSQNTNKIDNASLDNSSDAKVNASHQTNNQVIPKPNTSDVDETKITSSLDISTKNSNFIMSVRNLLSQLNETLLWASKLDPSSNTSPIRWDKISIADLHILRKLMKYIENNPNISLTAIEKGYQCNEKQKEQQKLISTFIQMDICSEIEWYKLSHLTWPNVKLIFDIGGNKGYLGSLFHGLWVGGGYGVNPITLFEAAKSANSWSGSRNPAGYCKDGLNYAIQLYCFPYHNTSETAHVLGRDSATGQCLDYKDDVKIHSFDGSSFLQSTVTSLFDKITSKNKVSSKTWTYHHAALSDNVGKVRFTKQGPGMNAGFEGILC